MGLVLLKCYNNDNCDVGSHKNIIEVSYVQHTITLFLQFAFV